MQTINQWIHLISFSLWIGSIFFFLFVFAPAVRPLPHHTGIVLLNQGRRNFQTASWIFIGLLLLTGIVNFILRGRTDGLTLLTLGSTYSLFLSTKLFFFLAMVVHHCIQVFKYSPKIETLTAQTPAEISRWPDNLQNHWHRWFLLMKINGVVGPLVLLLGLGLKGA